MAKKKDYSRIKPTGKIIPVEDYISELPAQVPEESIDYYNHHLTWYMESDSDTDISNSYLLWFDLDTKFIGWEDIDTPAKGRYHKRIHNVFRFKQAMKDWENNMTNWDWQVTNDA